jgi:hypothetical protein
MTNGSMHLVQILLPLYDNDQNPQAPDQFRRVRRELTDRFGGITIYTRAPAEGRWKLNENHTTKDDIVIFEVMAPELDAAWWKTYRHDLEERFRQDVIVIRAQQTRLL